jgi:protein-disulfide isomerase
MTDQTIPPAPSTRGVRWTETALAATFILAIIVVFWLLSSQKQQVNSLTADEGAQVIEPRLMLGSVTAPVAVVVVSDFQCPFCARFANTVLPELRRSLVDTGRVALYYRHFVVQGHDFATKAAEIAECADEGGQFWAIHDALFAARGQFTFELLEQMSRGLHSKSSGVTSCRPDDMEQRIASDQRWASDLGVFATPSFFIGKRSDDGVHFKYAFTGAKTIEEFRDMVDTLTSSPTHQATSPGEQSPSVSKARLAFRVHQ